MRCPGVDFRRHGKVSKGCKKNGPRRETPTRGRRALGAPWPGYSSSGCVPAEPDSASPDIRIVYSRDSGSPDRNHLRKTVVVVRFASALLPRKERPSWSRKASLILSMDSASVAERFLD